MNRDTDSTSTDKSIAQACKKCKHPLPQDALFCPRCGAKQQETKKKHRRRPNGFGSVYKLPGSRRRPWAVRKDGQYISYHQTRTEALEALERLSGHMLTESYNFTFRQVYEAWKPEHWPEIDEPGRYQYENAFAVFSDLHKKKFRDLRTNDFQSILDRHKDKAHSTVGKYKQLLTQMSAWAIKNEIITVNYASYCKVQGKAPKHHIPMTEEDIAKLEEAAKTEESAKIVCMLLATGMRIGELFRLPLCDYHGDYVIGGEKTEAGRDRIIPIRPEGREHFAYFAKQAEKMLLDGYVGNKDAKNYRRRDYYDLLDRLGIDREKTPHSTRVTYGTRAAIQEQLAPAALQKVMGHASFETTQKYYSKPDAATLVRAVETAGKQSA